MGWQSIPRSYQVPCASGTRLHGEGCGSSRVRLTDSLNCQYGHTWNARARLLDSGQTQNWVWINTYENTIFLVGYSHPFTIPAILMWTTGVSMGFDTLPIDWSHGRLVSFSSRRRTGKMRSRWAAFHRWLMINRFFFYPNLPKILGITIINHHNHQKNHCLPSIMESFLGFEHRASEYIIVYMSQDLISFYINGWTMLNHVTSCIEFMYGVCWNQWYFVGPAMSGIWGWLLLQPRFWGHHGSFESFERRSRDMKHPGTGRGHHQGSLVMSQR